MGKAYKNFWSLNTDEAVVTGILRDAHNKNIDVFMPLNAQMKDIDLMLVNTKTKKLLSIQVKGSRAYEPKEKESKNHGDGSGGWFFFPKKVIDNSTADYFIFLIYVISESSKIGRRTLKPHTIAIPTKVIRKLAKKYKISYGDNSYNFFIWINPQKKEAFDYKDKKFFISEYLDENGIQKMYKELSK